MQNSILNYEIDGLVVPILQHLGEILNKSNVFDHGFLFQLKYHRGTYYLANDSYKFYAIDNFVRCYRKVIFTKNGRKLIAKFNLSDPDCFKNIEEWWMHKLQLMFKEGDPERVL